MFITDKKMLTLIHNYHTGLDKYSRFRLLYMSPQLCPVQTRLHKQEQRRCLRTKRCHVTGDPRGCWLVYTLKSTSSMYKTYHHCNELSIKNRHSNALPIDVICFIVYFLGQSCYNIKHIWKYFNTGQPSIKMKNQLFYLFWVHEVSLSTYVKRQCLNHVLPRTRQTSFALSQYSPSTHTLAPHWTVIWNHKTHYNKKKTVNSLGFENSASV